MMVASAVRERDGCASASRLGQAVVGPVGLAARGPEDDDGGQKERAGDKFRGPCRFKIAEDGLEADGDAHSTHSGSHPR